jgi:Domain of unknown function (DUF4337)
MAEKLHELHEHAQHARHDPSVAPVTVTMAALAVLVAAVSLLGHRSHVDEGMLQTKIANQWAYYQAKATRRHSDEQLTDMAAFLASDNSKDAAAFREKYRAEAERYRDEQKELEAKGHELEQEVATERRRGDRFDLGEVLVEVALVITSITLLSGRRVFWYAGLVLGSAGTVWALTGLMIH